MAKGYCRDPDAEMRKILFGTKDHPAKLTEMSKATKIASSTLARYRKYPHTIPLAKLRLIVKWNGLDEKQIGELFK